MRIMMKQLRIYYFIAFVANADFTASAINGTDNETLDVTIMLSAIKTPPKSRFVSVHDRCTLICHGHYFATDEEVADILEQPWFGEEQFNKEKLNNLCPKLQDFKECLQQCHESAHKTAHLKYLEPAKFMCTQSFIQTTSCYKRVFKATERKCHGQNFCGQQKDSAERNYDSVKVLHTGNLTNLFSSQCSYYQCYHPCVRPNLIRACGEGEYEILKTLSQAKIQAHKQVWRRMGFEYDEPQNCRLFRNEDADS